MKAINFTDPTMRREGGCFLRVPPYKPTITLLLLDKFTMRSVRTIGGGGLVLFIEN